MHIAFERGRIFIVPHTLPVTRDLVSHVAVSTEGPSLQYNEPGVLRWLLWNLAIRNCMFINKYYYTCMYKYIYLPAYLGKKTYIHRCTCIHVVYRSLFSIHMYILSRNKTKPAEKKLSSRIKKKITRYSSTEMKIVSVRILR